MTLLRFIFSKRFFKHLLAAGVLAVLLPVGLYVYLSMSTEHGDSIKVPDLRSLKLNEASDILLTLDLTYVVIDSVFSEAGTPGAIFEQSPPPQAEVKEGRRVYLTMYRLTPPSEQLKVAEGMNERVAEIILENKGIRYEKKYVENQTLAGMVVEVLQKGKRLDPESNIKRGDRVSLVIGKRSDETVPVPSLKGMLLDSAISRLSNARLSVGSALYDGTVETKEDSLVARVKRQSPVPGSSIQVGSIVDLFLTVGKVKLDSTTTAGKELDLK